MTLHAGPYEVESEGWMLRRCLADFRLRPEREFALVDAAPPSASRKGRFINVWADGYCMTR